jgi:hypothetical protein
MNFWRMKERYNLEDISEGVRITSRLTLNCMLVCVLFLCGLSLEPVEGCCEHGNEHSGSITLGIFD